MEGPPPRPSAKDKKKKKQISIEPVLLVRRRSPAQFGDPAWSPPPEFETGVDEEDEEEAEALAAEREAKAKALKKARGMHTRVRAVLNAAQGIGYAQYAIMPDRKRAQGFQHPMQALLDAHQQTKLSEWQSLYNMFERRYFASVDELEESHVRMGFTPLDRAALVNKPSQIWLSGVLQEMRTLVESMG